MKFFLCGMSLGTNTTWCCTATLAGQLLSQMVVVWRLMVGPRASHSSSHCDEQWEACRVRHGTLGDALWSCASNSTRNFLSTSTDGLSLTFSLLLSSAAFYRLSCLCCCASNFGRRCGVLEADCRSISRTIFCEVCSKFWDFRFLASEATRRRDTWLFAS